MNGFFTKRDAEGEEKMKKFLNNLCTSFVRDRL
jgi:hypothetical protein